MVLRIVGKQLHCSQSPFIPWNCRNRALTVSGSHFVIGFKYTEGAGVVVYGGGDIFLAPPKSFPATLVIIFELTSLKTATDF